MARHRFSQKTKEWICFVCFFILHSKQIKFVRSFFGENLLLANLLLGFIWPLSLASRWIWYSDLEDVKNISSCSLKNYTNWDKLNQSLSQFLYFLRDVCLLFIFSIMSKKHAPWDLFQLAFFVYNVLCHVTSDSGRW